MYLIQLFQNTILFNHYNEYHKTVCILSNWLKIYLNVLIMTDISYTDTISTIYCMELYCGMLY